MFDNGYGNAPKNNLSEPWSGVWIIERQIRRSLKFIKGLEYLGTTLVGMTIEEDTAYIINIGDSRLYQIRGGITQITTDHSLVEEMVMSGEIKKDEMRTHPNKNIITRALGTSKLPKPDCFELEVKSGDVYLLCSDGLSNMIDDKEIEKIISNDGQTARRDRAGSGRCGK